MPERRALLGAGEDDVLGLAASGAPGPARRAPSAARRRGCSCPSRSGPTTALIPGPNSTIVRSANDLKPWSRSARRRGGASRPCGSVTSRLRRGRRPRVPCDRARRRLDRLGRGRGLGDPARRPLADARAAAVDRRPRSGTSFSWSGPGRVDDAGTSGRAPVRRWVYSWSRLFGLLSAPIGESCVELRARRASISQSRVGVAAEVEVERAGERLEGRGEERRPAPAAALRLALAEEQERAEVDPVGEAGEAGRRHDRGAAGATGRPRRRRDGAANSASEIARLTTASPRNSRRSLWPAAASGCSWSQLLWTSACSSRSRSRTGRPSRSASAAAGRTIPSPVARRRRLGRRARRCSRRRPGRCGSSPRPRRRSRSRTPPRGS